ncbi:4-alpha-glucanotransferase, partial [bacterium]|nr:4-alpha-glucanotransferase [bacterium]
MKIIPISTSILMGSSDIKIKKSHHRQCEHKVSYNPHYYMPRDLNKKYSNAISFEGVTGKGVVKQRGMLMHITSLPGTRSYCGQFGDIQTKKFIDFLSASKQTHWIMNPLNSLQSDLCPYNSNGRFSRNKFIVNLNRLTEKAYGNLLKLSELPEDVSSPVFTLDMLEKQKNPRFEIAHKRFQKLPSDAPI